MVKLYKSINYLVASLIFSPFIGLGQQLAVDTGTRLVMDGNINLVITDASLNNNGTLAAQGGTVVFKGSLPAFISGSNPSQFNNLSINKSADHLTLNTNISVKGNLNLLSNNILLNGKDIDLGTTGVLAGESALSYISGNNGGSVKAQASLNAPVSANPGNLGISISSASNLGLTTISRMHFESTLDANNSSIQRHFRIIPANNTNLNASVQFTYLDTEVGPVDESSLVLWASPNNGASWSPLGKEQQNVVTNSISLSGLSSLGQITAGTANSVLSVNWTSFTAQLQYSRVLLKWTTASETNNDRFEVYRSADRSDFELVTVVKGNGSTDKANSYSTYDNFPLTGTSYYRIKQIDKRGSFSFSEIRTVKSLEESFVKAYPNPAQNLLNVLFSSSKSGLTNLQIFNSAGLLVASRTENIQNGINKIEWPLNTIPGGTYLLRFGNLNIAPVKIIKQ